MANNNIKLAILYQTLPPPIIDGIIKPKKETGYADSGADIALALGQMNVEIITPLQNPDSKIDKDWVFPDTKEGIESAIEKGANSFWLNTVLYSSHPIESFTQQDVYLVGQLPSMVQRYDDKWFTNEFLRKHKLSVAPAILLSVQQKIPPLSYPIIAKPLRGRGSQGVSLVKDLNTLLEYKKQFFKRKLYGDKIILEEYLSGKEITLTVMPPGTYHFPKHDLSIVEGAKKIMAKHWCLPPVVRFNHLNGIAPYSGKVAVTQNSQLMPEGEVSTVEVQAIIHDCAYAAQLLKAKAPIRIDCRADEHGKYFLFDVNLKPNMTGASRSHRKDQDSLSMIAASALGWTYPEFVWNILQQRWMIC